MISANELRKREISTEHNGYNIDEVNYTIDEAAKTIDAYVNENQELYRKMEILASRIEEYREEEDSIKAALITAEKMADKIKKESGEEASNLISQSEQTAKKTIDEANEKADKIVSEARDYASSIIKEKTDEAKKLVEDAEKRANEAISSSKIVAQNVLEQAKEISEDLITKSKEEKQAYDMLISVLKNDAESFISNLKSLYSHQLDILSAAKLESDNDKLQENEESVDSLQNDIDSLISEIDEMENAIPESVNVEKSDYEISETDDTQEDYVDDPEENEAEEDTVIETAAEEEKKEENGNSSEEEFVIVEDTDPMAAVEAFSQDEITPVDDTEPYIPEIQEEAQMEEIKSDVEESLFDNEEVQPFETYFNIKREDAHSDRTQTISLVPPEDEDDEDGDEPKFKGFFKKKK